MTYQLHGHVIAQEPLPRGEQDFGRPFLGQYYYILSLSDICSWVENICKEMMHFLHMTDMSTPLHRNPAP